MDMSILATMVLMLESVASANHTATYSPLALNSEWPRINRLLFIVVCASFGTTVNGFFVSAFFIEDSLKKVGNVYLACLGMSDLVLTSTVFTTSAVVLLSGQWDILPVCKVLHFIVVVSTYAYCMFFTLVAAERFFRLCRPPNEYNKFVAMRIGIVTTLVYGSSIITGAIGVYLDLDYDYCERKHFGNWYFRVVTGILFHVIPSFLTFLFLVSSTAKISHLAIKCNHYKRSQQYDQDSATNCINFTAYLMFSMSWMPYLLTVYHDPGTDDAKFYHGAWLGLFRSIWTCFFYGSMNRNFRRANAHLFNYCCCKSALSSSLACRPRHCAEYRSTPGDVRVHIMHQAVNGSSPQRCSASRESQQL